MDTDQSGNGNSGPRKQSQVVITHDKETGAVDISGRSDTVDEAIYLCKRAIVELEWQIKQALLRNVLSVPPGARVPPFPRRTQ